MDRIFPSVRCVFIAILLGFAEGRSFAQQPPPPPVKGLDLQAMEQALDLSNKQKYDDAAKVYESVPEKYPASPYIPEAAYRLGYVQFLTGHYDESVATLEKVPTLKNATPEQKQLALSLAPQVSTAKAAKMKPDDPGRTAAFEAAIKEFDVFLQQYPASEEAETATYYKALALNQIGHYADAAATLRASLPKFASSPTVLDSEYLLALTLGSLANEKARNATAKDPTIDTDYNDAEKLLNDIIQKRTDIALLNDAHFQIGELALSRAGFVQGDARKALLNKALEYFRIVAPKESVIQAQQIRIAQFEAQRLEAQRRLDSAQAARLQRINDKEREKLANLQQAADETIAARIKVGQVYFQLGRYDETRVVLDFMKSFAVDDDQKKQIDYYTALSFAVQEFDPRDVATSKEYQAADAQLSAKAIEAYNQFRTAHGKDPIADNLALLVGARFVDSDPDKAITYFKESREDYPEGRFKIQALTQEAAALTKQRHYDEALDIFKQTITGSPNKEVSSEAEFGIATIHRSTGKTDDAIKEFKDVRDKYPGTPAAERSAYFVGQLLFDKGDAKDAVGELQSFVKKFPNSDLMAEAVFYLGQAQLQVGQKADAAGSFKLVGEKYPKSAVAPFSYFSLARMANDDQKYDECTSIMRAFIAAYPQDKKLYDAYDFIAQIQIAQSKNTDAIATYEEFVAKAPADDPNPPRALLRISAIWKGFADKLPHYIALNVDQRKEWEKDLAESITASEQVVNRFPESPQVGLALDNLLECQSARQIAKLISEADVEKYFQDLAKKAEGKPATRSNIIFTLARYTFEKDKKKAIEQMASAYDEKQHYAPADLDLYGEALIQESKLDDAAKVYAKLADDYPNPKGLDPTKASRDVQDAQAISLFGQGRVLREQGKGAEANQKFDALATLYPWSKKLLEANYNKAATLFDEKKNDEALKLLISVTRAREASTELRAKSMLLLAKVNEAQADYNSAINNYLKVEADFGHGVPALSAEGLWRGAQLLEKEANGQIAMPTPPPQVPKAKAKASPGAKSSTPTPGAKTASTP